MRRLVVDPSLCTECRMCQLACGEELAGGFNPRTARLKVVVEQEGLLSRPVVCNQCHNPFCLRACPVDAISRQDGVVRIDQELCTGCGLCVEHCYEGVIVMADDRARKCELCPGTPPCVTYCVTGALKLIEAGDNG